MSILPNDLLNQPTFLIHILDTTQTGIAVLKAVVDEQTQLIDFTFTYVNPTAEKIFGRSRDELLSPSQSYLRIFPSAKTIGLFDAYHEVLRTGKAFHNPELAYTWDGVKGWFDLQVSRYDDSLVLMFTDVTTRQQTHLVQQHQAQELQLLNHELQRTNENLLEFSYVVSHDLQEPLRKIWQFGDLLSQQYAHQLDTNGLDLLNRMKSASTRMSALIRDLLDYSRLTRQPEMFRPQDLNQIVDGVLTAIEVVVAEKGAVIEIDSLGIMAGDATQLAQLFQNLLTNAIKFAKPTLSPYIKISNQSLKRADLPAVFQPTGTSDSYCAIRVMDNGIGFSPEHAERIFGAFQRLHGKGQYPGSGIGLAIAKKVVENHGGYIMAQSQPGQGATFIIYLPILSSDKV